jgi:hypothetical protein
VYNVHFDPPAVEGVCDRCGALVHREDDAPETVQRRLEVYKEQTAPLIEHYEEHDAEMVRIDADRSFDASTRSSGRPSSARAHDSSAHVRGDGHDRPWRGHHRRPPRGAAEPDPSGRFDVGDRPFCDDFIVSHEGAHPEFKGLYGFPGSVCISINEEIVHGIPRRSGSSRTGTSCRSTSASGSTVGARIPAGRSRSAR